MCGGSLEIIFSSKQVSFEFMDVCVLEKALQKYSV